MLEDNLAKGVIAGVPHQLKGGFPAASGSVKAGGCSKYWRVFIDFRHGNQEED